MAIIFALISYLGWGIGDIFGTLLIRRIGAYSAAFWSFLFAALLTSPYVPFAYSQLGGLTYATAGLVIVLGVSIIIGLLAFNEGLRIGHPALVGVIAGSFPVIVVFLSVVFLHESITPLQLAAIVVIFSGMLLTMTSRSIFRKESFQNRRAILLAMIAMLFWGIFFTFIRFPVERVGWFWPNFMIYLMCPLILLFMRLKNIPLAVPWQKRTFTWLLLTVLFLRGAEWSFNLAVERGLVAIVAPIAGSYPTLFTILAFLVFKDPISRKQIAGVVTTVVGIVILALVGT